MWVCPEVGDNVREIWFQITKNMGEDWQDITKEKFEARREFFDKLFFKWRKKFCEDLGKQSPDFLNNEDKIIWRTDENGIEYNPRKLCTLYFGFYRREAKHLMSDPGELLDRHKIVALTQRLILEHYPITYSFAKPFKLVKEIVPIWTKTLNVSFAFYFALEFLGTWNKELHEKTLGQPFESDNLFKCMEFTDFAREHRKFLMLDLESVFPSILISQLWFALEQWGLEYMRHQPNVPREKPK